jgi:hypothetical protein
MAPEIQGYARSEFAVAVWLPMATKRPARHDVSDGDLVNIAPL